MRVNKRGAISFEQIILFILAIVVLIVVVAFFTGTFEKVRAPVDLATETIQKGIDCKNLCDEGNYDKFCADKCYDVSGVSCENAAGTKLVVGQGC